MTRVLVTAFEPFGGESVNPSQQAVRLLAELAQAPGVELMTPVLPVEFVRAVELLQETVEAGRPDLVICTSKASGRAAVTVERFAVNLDDAAIPDNAGYQPVEEPAVAGGPVTYASTLPVGAVVEALLAAGIPAAKSSTAGTYVSSHVFYALMHLIATRQPQLRGGFIHAPYVHEQVLGRSDAPPSLSLASITEALRLTVEVSARGVSAREGRPAVSAGVA